jgi:16S rRNA (cytosine1402-N4)-methyltransferase
MMDQPYHIPALLEQTVNGLNIRPNGTYVDVTFGGGGHSRHIFLCLGRKGRLVVFDQDPDAYANRPMMIVCFCSHNFRYIGRFLKYLGIDKVDGILVIWVCHRIISIVLNAAFLSGSMEIWICA